jgi:hypothetical protein
VRARRAGAALAAGLLAAGCAGLDVAATTATTTTTTIPAATDNATTTTAPPATTEAPPEVVAVGEEAGRAFLATIAEAGLRRWEQAEVRFAWHGSPTAVDRRVLADALGSLGALPGLPRLVVVADGGPAEVAVHALPVDQWDATLGDSYGHHDVTDAGGLAGTHSVDGRLVDAAVVVDADAHQTQRSRTIVHEVFHALGVGHHDCPSGIVYGGSDATPGWHPTELDLTVLALTYDRRLPAGISAGGAAGRLDLRPGEGPTCPPARYRTVAGPEGVLWCAEGPEAVQPCQRAEDNPHGGPHPGAPAVAWLEGEALSDHDPRTHLAFSFEGSRVLCERPTGAARSPCQRTETGTTVGAADYWTDGQFLYPDPG